MPARAKKVEFLIALDVPPGATIADVREYIADAVSTWRGSLRPPDEDDDGDPLWHLDAESIKVRRYRKPVAA